MANRAVCRRIALGMIIGVISALAIAPAGAGPIALELLEPRYRESVFEGWRSFQTSFASDGVACIHCHPRHAEMEDWAPSYPKAAVFDGTPYRVKGLAEVVGEALAIHTDLPPNRRDLLVGDLVSFIAWWGSGTAIKATPPRSTPAGDMALLHAAEQRGRELFETALECTHCHAIRKESRKGSPLASAAARFPRHVTEAGMVLPLTGFLRWHLKTHGISLRDEVALTDLAAFLTRLSEGEIYWPGTRERKGAGK